MLLTDGLQFLAQALYVVLFGITLGQALRRPAQASIEIALFFGAAALVVALGVLTAALHIAQTALLANLSAALLMALPYLLLRLAARFSELPPRYLNGAAIVLAVVVVGLFVAPQPYPITLVLALVVYFVVVAVGASLAFVRQASQSTGVTRRRLQCVAFGSACLGLDVLTAGFGALMQQAAGLWLVAGALLGLASGVLYFVGFAPPNWLRRAWQEPALRAFLSSNAQLVREPDTTRAVHNLEDHAARTLGAAAALGLWIEAEGVLRFHLRNPNMPAKVAPPYIGYQLEEDRRVLDLQPGSMIGGRVFQEQKPFFTSNAVRDDPEYAAVYEATGSHAAMGAPITAGDRRLGVLTAFASRAPIFADSDLELLQLLADQAAMVLESRALIEESARARAREEADRQKDDFLASISHDLRNPLTAVRGVTQVLERRLEREPSLDPERLAAGLKSIRGSTEQMASLIDQLLDYARLQMDRPLDLMLSPTDLVELTRRTVENYAVASERHHLQLEVPDEPIVGEWDAQRLERVVQNLVANAIKYSPDGGEVLVRASIERMNGHARAVVTVRDHGLGIPAEDVPLVFDRFHRAANVAGIPGSGLGLAASQHVIQQHGGSITFSSEIGRGSTFVVYLPLADPTGSA